MRSATRASVGSAARPSRSRALSSERIAWSSAEAPTDRSTSDDCFRTATTIAFVASGEMAVAFFMMHAPKGLIPYVNKGELAVVYCFVFFYIFLRGPASWSIDAMIFRGRTATATTL